MNVSYSRYELLPWSERGSIVGRPRRGALLRVDFGFGHIGYADCHPWPELGDLSLDTQLQAVRIGAKTAMLEQSLAFARLDADARAKGDWLFEGKRIPQSHASLPYTLGRRPYTEIAQSHLEWIVGLGFDTIKLKAGNAPVAEIQQLAKMAPSFLEHGLRVRLDFNEKLSWQDVQGFMHGLEQEAGEDHSWIEWLEDPCPFDAAHWASLRETFGLPIALDRAATRNSAGSLLNFDVLVVKPAVQPSKTLFELAASLGVAVCITSYLDHPLGQSCAALVAAEAEAAGVLLLKGGLVSHTAYEPTEFSCELGIADARLIPAPGTGFGFDDLLESLEWEDVR